jgi:hypothetical protein
MTPHFDVDLLAFARTFKALCQPYSPCSSFLRRAKLNHLPQSLSIFKHPKVTNGRSVGGYHLYFRPRIQYSPSHAVLCLIFRRRIHSVIGRGPDTEIQFTKTLWLLAAPLEVVQGVTDEGLG